MIARRNPFPNTQVCEPLSRPQLHAVRALVSEPGACKALREEERAFSEFVERCRAVVDYTDRLLLDLKEAQLVNDSILEHGTSIENELEQYREEKSEELAI